VTALRFAHVFGTRMETNGYPQFSTLEEEEKKRALAGFERRWDEFVGSIVE